VDWTDLGQMDKKEYGLDYQKVQVYSLMEKIGITPKKKQGLLSKAQFFNSFRGTGNHFCRNMPIDIRNQV